MRISPVHTSPRPRHALTVCRPVLTRCTRCPSSCALPPRWRVYPPARRDGHPGQRQSQDRDRAEGFYHLCLFLASRGPRSVTNVGFRGAQHLYDYVIPVDPIYSRSAANLYLMRRLDLNAALTKINLWRQTQFRKIVYVDADMVSLRAPEELFDLETDFAASPDIGWPDCFNSVRNETPAAWNSSDWRLGIDDGETEPGNLWETRGACGRWAEL